MESITAQASAWLAEKRANLERIAQQHAREHAERMAGLPEGTCERCYGTKRGGGYPCGVCEPVEVYAEGVPYEFRKVTLANFGEREGQWKAIHKASGFCDVDTGRDLYFHGGVGAGKTRLACAMANVLHQRRRMVTFHRVPLLLHRLQPGRDNGELEQRLIDVQVLVLDDIGAERDQATDYTRRTLLMLYEARHDAGKRTVFTSNKSVQEIGEQQDDDRLASRIAGRADVVKLTTPDQRLVRE